MSESPRAVVLLSGGLDSATTLAVAQAETSALLKAPCDAGRTVLLETAGSQDISGVDRRVIRIMDLKCPSSGEADRNLWSNLEHLRESDEVKFVIGERADYAWARAVLERHHLAERCVVLFSPVFGKAAAAVLARWVLADGLRARVQVQVHKVIWPGAERGV